MKGIASEATQICMDALELCFEYNNSFCHDITVVVVLSCNIQQILALSLESRLKCVIKNLKSFKEQNKWKTVKECWCYNKNPYSKRSFYPEKQTSNS
ncbi:CLUMA_CG001090, isoform A [Clunio marinus]|uniref:CLUMA_CG001090, isoform A n=1 Tax=Clunio marinus TaxID=568069 RepID=A0A1J1HGZ2_9DIPT|nr:CLUMA_CG001090, isoform A [Clunio marinus]